MADDKPQRTSSSSRHTRASSRASAAASAAAAARIKAEAAKAKLAFAERELKIKQQLEKLELEKIKWEKDTAEAEAATLQVAAEKLLQTKKEAAFRADEQHRSSKSEGCSNSNAEFHTKPSEHHRICDQKTYAALLSGSSTILPPVRATPCYGGGKKNEILLSENLIVSTGDLGQHNTMVPPENNSLHAKEGPMLVELNEIIQPKEPDPENCNNQMIRMKRMLPRNPNVFMRSKNLMHLDSSEPLRPKNMPSSSNNMMCSKAPVQQHAYTKYPRLFLKRKLFLFLPSTHPPQLPKLAPRPECSIPRMELCAAVLAVELSELISTEIDLQFDSTAYYTDSRVVLGYICNETRRFYVYVSNRVLRIRKFSKPEQWRHVSTEKNPADLGTRSVPASHLAGSRWILGPTFLLSEKGISPEAISYSLVEPDSDTEIRPQVSTLTTSSRKGGLGSQRFERFSTWSSLKRAVANLIHIANTFHRDRNTPKDKCSKWHYCQQARSLEELLQARNTIIRAAQEDAFYEDLGLIESDGEPSKCSPLKSLGPYTDDYGLLRVGGRLNKAEFPPDERHPIIIPGKHHIGLLLVRHYHAQNKHQGRLLTEGAIRAAGFWIIGGKRCVSKCISHCVTCRKLRGLTQTQKMADLPADRLLISPPFTNIGLDVFGPWTISARRTRGGFADSKRWAVIFVCLSSRGIHIEVIESLATSSFINALRRFFSIRGPAKRIRSDRGTNFIGACRELEIDSNLDLNTIRRYLGEQGCTWLFNPPHAPHMGGAWERMIGMAKRILDPILLQHKERLTHELLITFLAEVTSILNARPLLEVSTDPDDPVILTPATLLTQKTGEYSTPQQDFGPKDILRSQWKYVQHLAETFWGKWRKAYIASLQARTKWTSEKHNLKEGDLVLLKDDQRERSSWPLGLVTHVFPSTDKLVRKVEVKVSRKDGTSRLLRPIQEIVLLLP